MKMDLIRGPADYTLSLPAEIWYKIISDNAYQLGRFLGLNKHIQNAFDIFVNSPFNVHRKRFKSALDSIKAIEYNINREPNYDYGYDYSNINTYDWTNSVRKIGSKKVIYDQCYDATDADYNESAHRFVNYQYPLHIYVISPDVTSGSVWDDEPSSPIWIANIKTIGDVEVSKTEGFDLDDFIEKNKVKIGKLDDGSDWWTPHGCGAFRKDSWLNQSNIKYYMEYIPAFITMIIDSEGKLERKAITYMNNSMFD
jgi:hypothetical protein